MSKRSIETVMPSVRRLELSDWPWVSGWFEDADLDRALGPVDEAWLRHVMTDPSGVQLVVEDEDSPSALVGVAWDPLGLRHAITDFAINPGRRRHGLGSTALAAVMAWNGHPPTETGQWIAFVDPENHAAAAFFTASGWTSLPIDDGMLPYISPAQPCTPVRS